MRVVVLLSILFVIVAGGWMTEKRMASWQRPILVTVYPIVADGLPETERFVRSLDIDAFEEVNRFFERAAQPYGLTVTPAFRLQMAPPGFERPPEVPGQFDRLAIALYQHPVASSQRHVREVRHAVAAFAQQADDGDVEAAANPGMPHQFTD